MIHKTKHTKWKFKNIQLILLINLYRKISSTKMKDSNLLVSMILLFINEQYGKTKKGKKKNKTKHKNKRGKNKKRKKIN